jgi:hypothetical protein
MTVLASVSCENIPSVTAGGKSALAEEWIGADMFVLVNLTCLISRYSSRFTLNQLS